MLIVNATEVCGQMGHSNSGTTERIYIHLFDLQKTEDRVRKAMDAAQEAMV